MVAALVVPLVGRVSAGLARGITVAAPAVALGSAVMALRVALDSGPWHYDLGGWAPPWGIEYVVDPLGGGMAVLVALVGTLVAIYAGPHLRGLSSLRGAAFDSLFLLLISGLLGITLTGDLFISMSFWKYVPWRRMRCSLRAVTGRQWRRFATS